MRITKMELIQKIKAEIERLKEQSVKSLTDDEEHAQFEYDVACGYENALIELKSFIESLEKEQDGILAPDNTATNEEIEKMLKERRDKQRYEVLKAVEKEYGNQLNQAWDDALHEGYLNGWKECEAAWKRAQDELPKIKGWVARDKDWMYHFFRTKPQYYEDYGEWSNGGDRYLIPGELCHSVEDEPIEVELTIRKR